MVDYSTVSRHAFTPMKDHALSTAPAPPLPVARVVEGSTRIFPEEISVSLRAATLQKVEVATPNPLALRHRHVPDNELRGWRGASLVAGFGDLFYDNFCDGSASPYGHNGTGWEEPPWGYLKIHFTF